MVSTPIQATDEITIPAPVSEVWPVLADVAGYPRWWPKSLGIRVVARANGWLVFCLGKLMNLAAVHSRSMREVLKSLRHVLDQKQPGTNVGQ